METDDDGSLSGSTGIFIRRRSHLTATRAEPLHRKLYGSIAEAILGGEIESGARLASSRIRAKLLGVSRNTVFATYEALAADELIMGKHGAECELLATIAR